MADSSGLSAEDRDLLARTVYGEAADQGPEGQQAVAAVVLNRLKSGKFGGSIRDVLLAPHAFEPWQTRAGELLRLSPSSAAYRNAVAAVDAASGGNDPTSGATYFMNPDLVTARGDSMPAWATGSGQRIGAHVFYGGQGDAQMASADLDPNDAFSAVFTPPPSDGRAQQSSSSEADAGKGDAFDAVFGAKTPSPASSRPKTPVSAPPASATGPVAVNDVVRSAGRGVPIIGGLLNKADAATNAALAPVLNKFFPADQQLTGDFGSRYAQSLAQQEGMDTAYEQAHPYANGAGELAGGTAALAPFAATATGARLLGMVGNSLLDKTIASTVTGAVLGATDAATRGEDIRSGAETGAAFGFGTPAAGKIIGGVANKLLRDFRPQGSAARAITGAIADEASTTPDFARILLRNPRLTPMDVDSNLLLHAQGIAAQPGAGRAILANVVKNRIETAPVAVQSAYDAALGSVPDTEVLLSNLQKTARANASKGFGEALANAKPVDVSGLIKSIDDQINPGVNGIVSPGSQLPMGPVEQALARVKAKLTNGKEVLTDADRLHTIQQQMRTQAETLAASANGQDRLTAAALRDVRSQLNDAIDAATEGKFKPAQAQYADDMSIKDAFNKGLTIFRNRTGEAGLEDRPEYWRSWMSNASPDEQNAVRQGIRVAADQAINSVRSASRKGAALPEVEFNQQKLAAVLGGDEAARLSTLMQDEQTIARTNNALLGGSQTAARQQGVEATKIRDVTAKPVSKNATTLGLVLGAAQRGAEYAARDTIQSHDIARNRLLAKVLSEPGGKQFLGMMERGVAGARRRGLASGAAEVGTNLLLRSPEVHQPLEITVSRFNNLLGQDR